MLGSRDLLKTAVVLVLCVPSVQARHQPRDGAAKPAAVHRKGIAMRPRKPVKPVEPDPVRDRLAFEAADKRGWRDVLFDPCTGDWTKNWFLDGEIAAVSTGPLGMQLTAGPQFRNDAHHTVLWTRQVFDGDLRIEYQYTRLDFETRCVNILYVQATGSGKGPYKTDIAAWSNLRRVPAMKLYFNHMNAYHISYAAFPNRGDDREDYVRARRYMPEATGLKGTELLPDYFNTGLFQPGVPHRITVIKRGNDLVMRVSNSEKTRYFHWRNDRFPPIVSGRIGLRHMYTRSARYKDFRVSVPK